MADHKVISTSFDSDWRCLACAHTHTRPALTRPGADTNSSPLAFMLGDQSIPAILPCKSVKQCFKIIMIEHGSLRELVDELIKLVGNRRLPMGSTVLLFSATFMAETGLVSYTEEFLAVAMVLREKLGKSTVVLPLPPIVLNGSQHRPIIRSIFELMAWTDNYFRNENFYLDASTQVAREILQDQAVECSAALEFRRLMLPERSAACGRKEWNSGGDGCPAIPTELRPLSSEQEKRWLESLIEECRSKLALDLDPVPNLERGMGLQSEPKRKVDFMIIGSSNAARLTKAVTEAGYSVCKILHRNWRVSRESAEALARTIVQTAEQDDPAVVVLFMLDGSIFYAKGQDGSRTLPRKGDDGKFHIVGDLVVCSTETQDEHLNTLRPVLDAVGRRPCIIVSPMMRYVSEGCCQNPDHVKNLADRSYRDDMQRQLDGVTRSIKNFLFKTHRRNMRVLDSTYNTRHLPIEDIWFTDPVHPINIIYQHIASGVVKMAASLKNLEDRQDLKRRRSDSWDNRGQATRTGNPRSGEMQQDQHRGPAGGGHQGGHRGGHSGYSGHGGHRGRGGRAYRGLGGPRN
jgi:hypothetical protein